MSAQPDTLADPITTSQPAAENAPRLHRPEPARTVPLRQASTLLRESVAAEGPRRRTRAKAGTTAGAAPGAAGEGPVALGVRLGYQVIEEQILQGQKLAQRLGRQAVKAAASATGRGAAPEASDTAAQAAAAPGEVNELLGRVVDLYKDFGSLCVDAVETLARHPVLRAGVARAAPAAAAAAGAPAGAGFAVDILSSRRTQVTLDLRGGTGGAPPRVHVLHAADPATPPLAGASFVFEGAAAPVLRLSVPDTQPAGLYTGVVVDSLSNEPRGTLTVRLLA